MNFLLSVIAEIILEQLLKTSLKKLPESLKNKPNLRLPSWSWHHASVRRPDFVNRKKEMEAIDSAINEAGTTRILYFYGPGGIGKTRLIEEVEKVIQKTSSRKRPYWGGLYDLYHADLHDVLEFQDAIAEKLDPDNRFFQEYISARAQFEEMRLQGRSSAPAVQQELDTLFIENLRAFSRQQNRLVIALDTAETLAFESELIQSICQIKSMSVAVRDWLLQKLEHFENSVILLAGRPDPVLQQDLDKLREDNASLVESIMVRPLTRKESRDLLQTLLADTPELVTHLDKSDKLWRETQGNPVILTLVVEILKQAKQFGMLKDITDSSNIGESIVASLFNYADPASRTFFFLALARKGLTPELLHYLEPAWSKEECSANLSEASGLGVVKSRSHNELFLHDALYELFDQYSPPRSQLLPWYERIADYYRSCLARTNGERTIWIQTVTKLFYYELRLNPKSAFEKHYMRWDEEAIRGLEIGLDMQLRNEILRFIRSAFNQDYLEEVGLFLEDVERDSALRWVKRYLIQAQYQNALEISETIVEFSPDQYQKMRNRVSEPRDLSADEEQQARALFSLEDEFFWGQFLSLYGETLVYVGELNFSTQAILENAAKLLHQLPFKNESSLSWIQERSLGRAYDRLGYLLRSNGRYGKALEQYEHALFHYENAEVKDEQANTLNNMSFVQASLGLVDEAFAQVNRALTLRQELGQSYPIALSLNTRGLIQILRGQIEPGIRDCQTAFNIFAEMNSDRGTGLAYNALGWGRRQKGASLFADGMALETVAPSYQSAILSLERSVSIFSQTVDEPIRLWEAFNEMGSAYRDWGDCAQAVDQELSGQKYDQAQAYYHQALEIAEEHNLLFQLADTHDDLAQIAVSQGNPQSVASSLDMANKLVSDYLAARGPLEQGDAYWFVLGKIGWQQAMWNISEIKQGHLTDAKKHQAIRECANHFSAAIVHFQKYWPDTALVASRYEKMLSLLTLLHIPLSEIRDSLTAAAEKQGCDLSFLSR